METLNDKTENRASKMPISPEISAYFKGLQRKSSESRKKNNPNTYRVMAKKRWDKETTEVLIS